ncbi:MAG: GTP-binding protein, partial [candidate division WOR-3 bacterium]
MSRGVELLRNIGLFGHATTGKTTLSEAILYISGTITKMGNIEAGNTVMDFDEEEKERGNSINLSVAKTKWKNYEINLVDTPGFANFITDAYCALRAIDGAIVLSSIVEGVKVQTERMWMELEKHGIPRLIFLNEVDKLTEEINIEAVCKELKESLNISPTILTLPLIQGGKLIGIVDILEGKLHQYENGKKTVIDINEDIANRLSNFRERCLENILETNEELMEKYLEGETITKEDLFKTLISGVKENKIFPVLSGSALKLIGIDILLDYATALLPSPIERPPVKGINPLTGEEVKRKPSLDEPFSALVFKTYSDPYAGKITLIRVFSGRVSPDATVYNTTRDVKEKLNKPSYLVGKEQKPVMEVTAGEILAVTKLKDTKTGDTLSDLSNPIKFEPIEYPNPILSCAIKAKGKQDEEKISNALQRMMEEDPALE